ncbi:type II toxin-antitoxin system Phd/YefM family antitoxin [Cellulomonas shaoxiangyii]|uniref:Antitoxin n=1 Tax=Cellulomonas shaoxiangyii TaxID=2566013 RepID=A0A4V1CMX7_9CELL|nr:type II toxin-antitoxin system prevent-host-death family antitoxin [Cellulomonas shaoxiangyii]QCB94485.1 type II toxin-antitoxin system prevent-host-death family antitoxin [Cellulomonas shaoxiangyii]TGY86067.1 type II toxin-antitoxin system prevent-host-death family antitoxin [Cellulomonas shaoxiangyii]
MRTVTATHASRGFSDLLDAVEHGETIAITRAGHVVAEIRPAAATTGRALREALAGVSRLDEDLESDIAAATALLTTEQDDPWRVD